MTRPSRYITVFMCALLGGLARGEDTIRLRFSGGAEHRSIAPLVVAAPESLEPGSYEIVPAAGESARAAQVFEDGGRKLAILLSKPKSEPVFVILRKTASLGAGGIAFEESGKNLRVLVDHEPFTEHVVGVGHKPFLYPLVGPAGSGYTRAYPMRQVEGEDHDHPHQRSFWFTHGDVDGIDFWSETPRAGSIREVERKLITAGPVLGRFRSRNEWIAPGGKLVCEDERTFTFFSVSTTRVIDLEVVVKAARGAVTFGDTKEGTFGLRVASSMDVSRKRGGRILNAEGQKDDAAWGKPSAWVDYTGPVAGQTLGITVFDHPESFRHPTTWHVRTYGLFAANPFGYHDFGRKERGDHTIPAGESIRFRYRVILHPGVVEASRIDEDYSAFAKPPTVAVERD